MTEQLTTQLTTLERAAADLERRAGAVESMLLSVVGRLASWVGPVPVALFTASELDDVFSTSPLLALIAAVAMELIGVNLASRWMKFKLESDAEERLALRLMGGFYGMDFIITALIVARRIADGGSFTYTIAALFPIAAALSIVSLNQSIGAQRRKIALQEEQEAAVAAQEAARLRRKAEREERKASQQATASATQDQASPAQAPQARASLSTTEAIKVYYSADPRATQASVAASVGVKRQRVGQVLAALEQAGEIRRNGHGVEIL